MTGGDEVAAAFDEAGLDPATFVLRVKPGPPTPLRTYLGPTSVLTVAVDDDGRRRNVIEQACRAWASEHRIDTPPVMAASPSGSWLQAGLVRPTAPEGPRYVDAALDMADRISALAPPPVPVASSTWQAGASARVVSAVRNALGGLDVPRFLRARREAAALDDRTTCHGDFYRRNVLAVDGSGVSVVDWEFVGPAPRWTDHVRFWSTLRRREDRLRAWSRIRADAEDTEHLHVLTRWLVHRLLAENLAARRSERDQDDLTHARTVVAEAAELPGPP